MMESRHITPSLTIPLTRRRQIAKNKKNRRLYDGAPRRRGRSGSSISVLSPSSRSHPRTLIKHGEPWLEGRGRKKTSAHAPSHSEEAPLGRQRRAVPGSSEAAWAQHLRE